MDGDGHSKEYRQLHLYGLRGVSGGHKEGMLVLYC